jgi:transposase-like protein
MSGKVLGSRWNSEMKNWEGERDRKQDEIQWKFFGIVNVKLENSENLGDYLKACRNRQNFFCFSRIFV